ncbi:hypothetical protein [Effusibacillus pohliae]|uniref:hypothetical protein n=1 Tax=Effusibacillus pohliae TaxID=232270 RepID=UPI00036974D9|nr:hypothetical protein [Effusibacillus pohliae]
MAKRIPKPVAPVILKPKKWQPSLERQAEMDNYLWDRHTMRIYCDCSISQKLGAHGVAAAFVFDGSVIVRSRKVYDLTMKLRSTHGELQAVLFALRELTVGVPGISTPTDQVIVYTDVQSIETLIERPNEEAVRSLSKQITGAKMAILSKWPDLDVQILFLPPEEQKHNPWYTAAHNAARREVSLGR